MSKLEVKEIGPISGETDLKLGQSGGTVTLADGATAVGFAPEPTESPVKAWVNFNGTGTVAIRDSMNVSSITDDGTGIYTVNFTTAFPDTNYACVGAASNSTETHGNHTNVNVLIPDGMGKTTSAQPIECRYAHSYFDPIVVSVVFIGS